MTTQEAYDGIKKYFSQPGAELAIQRHRCMYRTGDNRKCALGCLIPDELYAPEFENLGALELWDWFPDLSEYFGDGEIKEFLAEAQRAHDSVRSVSDFLRRLDRVADLYDLKTTKIHTCDGDEQECGC